MQRAKLTVKDLLGSKGRRQLTQVYVSTPEEQAPVKQARRSRSIDGRSYQEAGAIGVEMEVVPHRIAAELAGRVKIVVLSMGSGTGCDGQYLFATDILGANRGHVPRHAKVYRDFRAEHDRLYGESVAAFREFKADVDTGSYPEAKHLVEIDDREYNVFMRTLEHPEGST